MPSVMLGESCDTCNHYTNLGDDAICHHPAAAVYFQDHMGQPKVSYHHGPKHMAKTGVCEAPYYQVWTKRKPRAFGPIWGGTAFRS